MDVILITKKMGNRAITEPLALTTDYVSLDGRYTDANGNPYASVAAAEAALGRRMNQYTVGLTVLVKESGWTEAKEYWVQPKGTTPETYGLVVKGEDLTKALSLSGEQKHNASANINDRAVVVDQQTSEVKALGYKVLNPALGFSSQVTAANTVFEIKDEFDLDDGSVTIPTNCTLKFNGGRIVGGELQGNKTRIEAGIETIFNTDTQLSGSWDVEEIYPEWFGAKADGVTDDTSSLENSFLQAKNASIFQVKLGATKRNTFYTVSRPIEVQDVNIRGTYDKSGNSSATVIASSAFVARTIDEVSYKSMFLISGKVNISNVFFNGNLVCNILQNISGASGVIEDCLFYKYVVGYVVYGCEDLRFDRNYFNYGGIAVRASSRAFDYTEDIYNSQTSTITRACNILAFNNNRILFNNIGVFIENSSNADFINNTTGHNQICAIRAIRVGALAITDSYSEGDGVVVSDILTEGVPTSTSAALTTSTALINANLDGMLLNGIMFHGIIQTNNCDVVKITGTSISYKKRGLSNIGENDFHNFDFTRTKAGVDALVIDSNSQKIFIDNNRYFNWNAQGVSNAPINACVVYGLISGVSSGNLEIKNWQIDKTIIDPVYFANNNPKSTELSIETVSNAIRGVNLNTSLRFSRNNYTNTLNSSSNVYSEANGMFMNEVGVVFEKVIKGIPFYKHTSNVPFYSNISNDDIIAGANYIEVCRFVYFLENSASPKITAYHYNTSGSNKLTVEEYGRSSNFRTGGVWLQRLVLAGAKSVENLRNIIVFFSCSGTVNTTNMQKFLFSPPFVRELGSDSIPDFSTYYFYRDKGTTAKRPTLGSTDKGFKYYDTTINKPIWWNGTTWIDGNGNLLTEIQVSDKSVLLQASASSNTVEVYTSDTPTIAVKNPDDTTATWLSAALSGTTLTISATANTILVAPEFGDDTYYSESGGVYTLLSTKPANWDTNYADYYTEEDGVHSAVEGVVAPATNPRGGKVVLTNTTDEVVINVVQNYV